MQGTLSPEAVGVRKDGIRDSKQRESLSDRKEMNTGSLKMSLENREAPQKEEGNWLIKPRRVLITVSPL